MGGTTSTTGVVTFGFVWTVLDEVEVLVDVEVLVEVDDPVGITIGVIVGIVGVLHFPLI